MKYNDDIIILPSDMATGSEFKEVETVDGDEGDTRDVPEWNNNNKL